MDKRHLRPGIQVQFVEPAKSNECTGSHQADVAADVRRRLYDRHQQLLPLLQGQFLAVTTISLARSTTSWLQHHLLCVGRLRHRHRLSILV